MMKMTKQMLASLTAVSTAASAVASLAVLPAFATAHAAAPEPRATSNTAAGTLGFHAENVLGTSLDMAVTAPSRTTARAAEKAARAEFDGRAAS